MEHMLTEIEESEEIGDVSTEERAEDAKEGESFATDNVIEHEAPVCIK